MAAIRKDTRDTPSTFPELRSDVDAIQTCHARCSKKHAEVALAATSFSQRDWLPSRNQPTYVVMGEWGHWPPFIVLQQTAEKKKQKQTASDLRIHFTPFKEAHALDSAYYTFYTIQGCARP